MYKTRIEGNNMFCDYYNPSSRTYCKRLRVMCPEHTKAPLVGDSEVAITYSFVTTQNSSFSCAFLDCVLKYNIR